MVNRGAVISSCSGEVDVVKCMLPSSAGGECQGCLTSDNGDIRSDDVLTAIVTGAHMVETVEVISVMLPAKLKL